MRWSFFNQLSKYQHSLATLYYGNGTPELVSSTEKYVMKDPTVAKDYQSTIEGHVEKGYLRKVNPAKEELPRAWYLPHFPIVRMSKTTTKVRIVYIFQLNMTKYQWRRQAPFFFFLGGADVDLGANHFFRGQLSRKKFFFEVEAIRRQTNSLLRGHSWT